jgi:hypothetical protein
VNGTFIPLARPTPQLQNKKRERESGTQVTAKLHKLAKPYSMGQVWELGNIVKCLDSNN